MTRNSQSTKNNQPERPNKAARKLRKQVRAKSTAGEKNHYLAALVDPDHTAPCGIPDQFGGLTHPARVITQRAAVFHEGKSAGIVKPQLDEFLTATTATSTVTTSSRAFDTIHHTQFVQSGRSNAYYSDKFNWVAEGVYRLRKPTTTTASSYRYWEPPFNDSDEQIVLQEVEDDSGRTCQAQLVSPGGIFYVSTKFAINATSNTKPYIVTTEFSDGPKTVTEGSFYTNNVTSEQAGAVTIPANAKWLCEYGVTACAVSDAELDYVSGYLIQTTPANVGTMTAEPIGKTDLSEYDLLKLIGDTYRFCALSVWLQYNGALTSNGRVAIAFVQEHSDNIGSNWKFNDIASLPGAYVGPLNKGAYCYTAPVGLMDFSWKHIENPSDNAPYIVFSMTASDTPAEDVTIRCAAHIEVQTTNQVISPVPSSINPDLITDTLLALRGLPHAMENDSHMQKIASFLRDQRGSIDRIAKVGSTLSAMSGNPEIAAIINLLRNLAN